jgi:O-antigen/teichoic acid export membrane protein
MNQYRNNFIVIFGVAISSLLAFAFHFITGRLLGPEEFGEFGALMAILFILTAPFKALNFTVTKYATALRTRGISAVNSFVARIQKDTFFVLLIVSLILIIGRREISNVINLKASASIIWIAVIAYFATLLSIERGRIVGDRDYRTYSINLIWEAVIRIVLLLVFLLIGMQSIGALLAFGFAYLLAVAILRFRPQRPQNSIEGKHNIERREVYKYMLGLLVAHSAIQLAINLPTLYVKHGYSSEFTGYWNAALTVARASLVVTNSVGLVLFSEVSNAATRIERRETLKKSSLVVLAISSAIALIFFFMPDFIINILYGAKYSGAAPVLKYMGFAMILFSFCDLLVNYYFARRKSENLSIEKS